MNIIPQFFSVSTKDFCHAHKDDISLKECELLLAYVCRKPQSSFLTHPDASLGLLTQLRVLHKIAQRKKGVPIAYLVGTKEFYGRRFAVNRHTLIPRPESELLIDLVAKEITNLPPHQSALFLDLGTGSGNLITTLACETLSLPIARRLFLATDISRHALRCARKNSAHLCPTQHVQFYKSDLLSDEKLLQAVIDFIENATGPTHLFITANLPYVDDMQKKSLLARPESQGLAFEPQKALWSHDGGLGHYKQLLPQLAQLRKNIPMTAITTLYEIDDAQASLLSAMLTKTFPHSTTATHRDLAGKQRVITHLLRAHSQSPFQL